MFNTKENLENIIDQHGHFVIVGHKDKDSSCQCVKEQGSPDPDCNMCLGIGAHFRWKPVKTFREPATYSLDSNQDSIDKPLNYPSLNFNYFFKAESGVKTGDILVEYKTSYIFDENYCNIFNVKNAVPREGDEGRTIFIRALSVLRPTHKRKSYHFMDYLRKYGLK